MSDDDLRARIMSLEIRVAKLEKAARAESGEGFWGRSYLEDEIPRKLAENAERSAKMDKRLAEMLDKGG